MKATPVTALPPTIASVAELIHARINMVSGEDADAMLYLGPPETLTQSPVESARAMLYASAGRQVAGLGRDSPRELCGSAQISTLRLCRGLRQTRIEMVLFANFRQSGTWCLANGDSGRWPGGRH